MESTHCFPNENINELFLSKSGFQLISKPFKPLTKKLFLANSNSKLVRYYSQHNGPLLFIISERENDDKKTRLHVVDSITTELLGNSEFKLQPSHIQMVLYDECNSNVHKISDISGIIYYSNSNTLYCCNFYGDTSPIKTFSQQIEALYLLNSNFLLVILKSSLLLVNVNENKQEPVIVNEIKESDTIQFIETTIPKETVFTTQYLNSVDSITIFAGFKESKLIKRYEFNNNQKNLLNKETYSLKWNYFGFGEWCDVRLNSWRESFIIDDSFMIDKIQSNKNNNLAIRFAVQEELECDNAENINDQKCFKTIARIVESFKDGTTNVTEIDEKTLGVEESHKNRDKTYRLPGLFKINCVELEALAKNKIILKLRTDEVIWTIFVYNLENKELVKYEAEGYRLNVLGDFVVTQQNGGFGVYKLTENGFNNLQVVEVEGSLYNEVKTEIKYKNGKFLRIGPKKRVSLVEIDYINFQSMCELNDKDKIKVQGYGIESILDTKHILVRLVRDDMKFNLSVFDVSQQKIVNSLVIDDIVDNIRVSSFNKDYVLIRCATLKKVDEGHIYKIVKKQDSFEFILLHKMFFREEITENYWLAKCHSECFNPNMFTITFRDGEKNCVEVRSFKETNENKLEETKSCVTLDKVNLDHRKLEYVITSLSKYLILFQLRRNLLYCIDPRSDTIKDVIEFDSEIKYTRNGNVQSIPNTDDLVIKHSNVLYHFKFDTNSNKYKKMKIKEYGTDEFEIKIERDYLSVCMKKNLEVYKLNELKLGKELVHFAGFERTGSTCLSCDGSHMVIKTEDDEVFLYKLENLQQIASLHLNEKIYYVGTSEEYMSILTLNFPYLITLKIVK